MTSAVRNNLSRHLFQWLEWLLLFSQLNLLAGTQTNSAELMSKGNEAFKKGDRPGAVAFFTQAISADPSNYVAYYNRGRLHDNEGRSEQALADYSQLLKIRPEHSATLQLRGSLHLRLGHFDEAIADFDQYLKLLPANEPYHWQRGIALYYAGRYEESRLQWKKCHLARSNDVETALWHFACVARSTGLKEARASLPAAGNDPRLPLIQLHSFFAGKIQPEEVIATAQAGKPAKDELSRRLFLAEFYLGLYQEAGGNPKLALEHLDRALEHSPRGEFLVEVARSRAEILRKSTR
jgi:lipoprotein NlpI